MWKVLQQNDENMQLNVIIMSHVVYESLSNFSLRRWGGRYRGIKNETSSRVITVVDTDKNYYKNYKNTNQNPIDDFKCMERVYTFHSSSAICYLRLLFACTLMHWGKHEMGQIINYLFERCF